MIQEQSTPLSQAFFHPNNIKIIQRAVIAKVYRKTGYLIPEQDESKVMVVMRSLYLQHNLRGSLKEQIRSLDKQVIDEITSDIVSTIGIQAHYIDRISNGLNVLDRPEYTSRTGTNAVRMRF